MSAILFSKVSMAEAGKMYDDQRSFAMESAHAHLSETLAIDGLTSKTAAPSTL